MQSGIGTTVRRKEDLRLVTGRGCYSDDFNFPDQAYGAAVRSPHAHALIRGIDVAAARAMPGVLAVLTGADALADGLTRIPHLTAAGTPPDIVLTNRDGSPVPAAPHYVLPTDRVRHVGTAVAFVIAETVAQAKDAAEKVVVDYEPLPAVIDAKAAVENDAPRLYDDLPNIMIDAEIGDAAATDAAFARAAHVTRLDTWVNRVTGVPMEPRAAVGIYDAATGRYTLYAGSGGIVRQKKEIAAILGVPFDNVRVIAQEIGGNFGTRNSFFPEFALVVWGSRRVGRPVKWTADRHEAFVSDYMGRDLTRVGGAGARRRRPLPRAAQRRISAMSAPIPAPTCRWSRASAWRRPATAFRPRMCKRAPCCRRRCARRPIAAPAGRKSST